MTPRLLCKEQQRDGEVLVLGGGEQAASLNEWLVY